jgi:hypothetical protein
MVTTSKYQGALTPDRHHGAFGRTFVVYWTLRVKIDFIEIGNRL